MPDMKKEQERDELHRAIWAIADELRGAVDGWDFKNYVLGTMFYRYISENLCNYINSGEIEAGNEDFDYKTVGDVATITRGRVMSKDYIKENHGEYPVYSSQTENFGELGCISTYDFDGEYLTWTTDSANAGSVFYRNGKFSITNVCGLIKVSDYIILTRFLYYILSVEAKKYVSSGMGNPKLMSNVMSKVKVPIPPLEVQQEIVRILDQFTELTAELTARKKQYEYYRNHLFISNNLVPIKRLEISLIFFPLPAFIKMSGQQKEFLFLDLAMLLQFLMVLKTREDVRIFRMNYMKHCRKSLEKLKKMIF